MKQKNMMSGIVLLSVALVILGYQNCSQFEAQASNLGRSQPEQQSEPHELTEAEAIQLGQSQGVLSSAGVLPWYCSRYPQYIRFWPQCQVAVPNPPLMVNPLDQVYAGSAFGLTIMNFQINTSATALSNIEIQLEYTLSNNVQGATDWVNAANGLGTDWSAPTVYRPNYTDHEVTSRYTLVPHDSYLAAVKFIRLNIRTKDGRFLNSATYNLPNPVQI